MEKFWNSPWKDLSNDITQVHFQVKGPCFLGFSGWESSSQFGSHLFFGHNFSSKFQMEK